MRIKSVAILLFCGLFAHSVAQEPSKIDSLLSVIVSHQAQDVGSAINAVTNLLDGKKMGEVELLAPKIFEKLSGTASENKMEALLSIGRSYQDRSLTAWAIRFYKEANDQAGNLNSQKYLAFSLRCLAGVYFINEVLPEGLKYSYEASRIFETRRDYSNTALMLYQAVSINYKSGNYNNCVIDFESFLKNYEKVPADSASGDLKFSAMSGWNTVALAHSKMKNWVKSLEAFQRALQFAKESENQFWIALVNGNKGNMLFKMGKPKDAIPFVQEDLRISTAYNQYSSAGFACISLAEIFIELHNTNAAKSLLDSVPRFIGLAKTDRPQLRLYYARAQEKYYSLIKDFEKAHHFLLIQMQLGDSIHNKDQTMQLAQIQTRYNLESKENEIHLLTENNELQRKEIDAQRKLIFGSIVFVFLVVCFLFYFIVSYRKAKKQNDIIAEQRVDIEGKNSELEAQSLTLIKQNEEIEEKNTELEAQSFTLLQQNEIIRRSNQDLESKVSERTSQLQETIQELDTFLYHASHDIRRPIATLLGLENVARAENAESAQLLEHVAITARGMDSMLFKLQMAYRINQPTVDLKKVVLKDVVYEASKKFCDQLKQYNIDFVYEEGDPVSFVTSPSLLMVAFQNLIENAIQFRNPDKETRPWIKISADQSNVLVKITVEDSGIGIDKTHLSQIFDLYYRATDRSKGNGVGLYLTKKSLSKIHGDISAASTFGEGTIFTISIPVDSQNT
ncbi:MAG: hypothetical protein HY015_04705 [Bacteroidetes bacterium]|nr:hypothetical protein [Bacteroidota bacterium]MBI3482260.1 hypothetical protein [Bacteroidota bacterium]